MRKTLYFTVFFSGIASLALEMAASRLLERTFGQSNLVWAAIIGLILIYLAVGYYLGGMWADKSPSFKTMYKILTGASVGIMLVPVIAKPILRLAADAFDKLELGILFGSFTVVIILLVVPVVLLGTLSPFAIRLAISNAMESGRISGRIYAISTFGSFIGTFLPVLLLIPLIGTNYTFLVIGGGLLLVSLAGMWITSGWKSALPLAWTILLIPIIYFWGLPGPDKSSQGQIYETESSYNYIQVLRQNGYTVLRLNEGQGMHSVYNPDQLNYYGPWEQVSVAPFFNPAPYSLDKVHRIAIIGLAAGTSARQATAIYGPVQIDGYELDPKVVDVGRRFFDMNEANLNVFVQDGRYGLEHSANLYQIISVDAYRPPYIPWHLTTQEFFQIVYDHLAPDGVMVINVGRSPTDRRLINALSSTILTVFPTIHIVDVPNTFNSMIFATRQPTSASNLAENLDDLQKSTNIPRLLTDTMQVTVASLAPPPAPSMVFTDDHAPIEWITNDMILSYLLSDNPEKSK